MTMTTVKSAYPASIDDLMPKARAMAGTEGLPSQNRLKETLRIGRPKARDIREALEAEGFQTRQPEPTDQNQQAGVDSDAAPAATVAAVTNPVVVPEPDSQPEPVNLPDPASGAQRDTVELPAVAAADEVTAAAAVPQATPVADPPAPTVDPEAESEAVEAKPVKPLAVWPVLLLMLPATVAIWSGWVGLGQLAGFGPINPLPGIWDSLVIDTSITLPIGMETYSAYALYVWLSGRASAKAVSFARTSAILALVIGSAGQVAYHLIAAPDAGAGPVITAAVACIPVAVLGLGAALAHLVKNPKH